VSIQSHDVASTPIGVKMFRDRQAFNRSIGSKRNSTTVIAVARFRMEARDYARQLLGSWRHVSHVTYGLFVLAELTSFLSFCFTREKRRKDKSCKKFGRFIIWSLDSIIYIFKSASNNFNLFPIISIYHFNLK